MTRDDVIKMALDAGGRMYSSDEVDFFLPDLERFAAAVLADERDALLAALKMLVLATKDFSVGNYNEEVHDIALSKARAAIKQAEEKV